MIKNWYDLTKYCSNIYGVHVDLDEGFFVCPECQEPIYSCDWSFPDEFDIGGTICCPICEEPLVEDD